MKIIVTGYREPKTQVIQNMIDRLEELKQQIEEGEYLNSEMVIITEIIEEEKGGRE